MFNETVGLDVALGDYGRIPVYSDQSYCPPQVTPIYPGQVIARKKLNGLGTHYGVALGGLVFHSQPGRGAHYTHPTTFGQGLPVWTTSPPPVSAIEYRQMLRIAQAWEGTPWTPGNTNCEDVANAVRYGIPKSPTRNGLLILSLAIALWFSEDN